MTSIPQVANVLRTVLTTTANRAARATRFVQRRSKLSGAKFVQTLVFGWLANPEATYEELAQTAATLGVRLSPQGLEQRFTEAAAQCIERVLQAAVQQVITATPVAIPLLQRFPAVYVDDSTQVQLPAVLAELWAGSGGGAQATDQTAALKLQVRLDLKRGGLRGPFLQAGRASDRTSPTQHGPVPAGSLRLADLGYFALAVLQAIAQQQAYWLTRLMAGTQVYDPHGQVLDLAACLPAPGSAGIDRPVRLGVHHRLPARLIAVRVPQEVANQRRRDLHAEARRRGRAVSQARVRLADWTLFCTNVPPDLLSGPEVLVVARVRWQIELVFKLGKSSGHLAHSRSAKPWRVLCEVYAKLLGLLIQHWVMVTSLWRYPDRSAWKAAQTLRKHALHLASAFVQGGSALCEALKVVQRTLAAGCRLNKRKKVPSTFQLLLALTEEKLA
jgi:Transposase DDE domain